MSLESKLRECADELPTGDDRTAYLLREAAKAIEAQRSALESARVVLTMEPCCERAWVANTFQPPDGEQVIVEHQDGERRLATWTGRSWKCEGEVNTTRIVRWASLPRESRASNERETDGSITVSNAVVTHSTRTMCTAEATGQYPFGPGGLGITCSPAARGALASCDSLAPASAPVERVPGDRTEAIMKLVRRLNDLMAYNAKSDCKKIEQEIAALETDLMQHAAESQRCVARERALRAVLAQHVVMDCCGAWATCGLACRVFAPVDGRERDQRTHRFMQIVEELEALGAPKNLRGTLLGALEEAASAPKKDIPEGWKLVPAEPTKRMTCEAFIRAAEVAPDGWSLGSNDSQEFFAAIYQHMLKTAPDWFVPSPAPKEATK